MKFVLVLACCILIPSTIFACDNIDKAWEKYKRDFNKSYSNEEDKERKRYFEESYRTIQRHNKEADQGKHSWYMGLNELSDMSPEEEKQLFNGCAVKEDESHTVHIRSPKCPKCKASKKLPKAVDWRKKNVLPPVKKQGHCGSCWIFGTVGAVEAHTAKKRKKVVRLSEQNIVDCAWKKSDPHHRIIGCHGADIADAFEYIKKNGGINTEKYYPYKAKKGPCRFSKRHIGGKIKDYVKIEDSEEKIREVVATRGPVAGRINASDFRHYNGTGVFRSKKCSGSINHAVLIVGYGEKNGEEYWILRNSWGPTWGNKGYMYIARNAPFMCRIGKSAIYPIV